MKKFLILAGTAALALLLTACNKEEGESVVSDNGTKSITVTISGANLTKAAIGDSGDATWDADADVSSVQVYFTDASGVVKYVYSTSNNDDLTALKSGVRFINLTGVSAVYVTANATAIAVGANVSTISADLTTQNALAANTAILYMGADKFLEIGNGTYDSSATTALDASSNWTATSYSGSQYYYANVSIRPVISRLEISKIQAEATGYDVFEDSGELYTDADGNNRAYIITWSGFKPNLKGIYMSNFYGKITPVTPSVSDGFANPGGDPIDESSYLWGSTSSIGSSYNADGVTLYINSGSNLFTESDSSPYYVYFTGSSTCVPFNFLVPFDVTLTAENISKSSVMEMEPQYHFLFNTTNMTDYACNLYLQVLGSETGSTTLPDGVTSTNSYSYRLVDKTTESALYQTLTADYALNTVGDNNYYANITSLNYASLPSTAVEGNYTYDESTSTYTAVMAPNKIYQLSEVTIAPNNLISSTKSTTTQAVVVTVTSINYAQESVTANFNE